MKLLTTLLIFLFTPMVYAQTPSLPSGVFKWEGPPRGKSIGASKKTILTGSTTALGKLNVSAYALEAGESTVDISDPAEKLIIVKSGELTVSIGNSPQAIGPGSVAVIMVQDAPEIANHGKEKATYYVFRYEAKARPASQNKQESFIVDWDDLDVRETGKGGRRDFFDRATTMFDRFEMHVTTLNPGLQSHDPHTHKAEEFLLVIEGEVEEQIGETFKRASKGDLIFLDSMVPHTIKNVGKKPATYFAFQWE